MPLVQEGSDDFQFLKNFLVRYVFREIFCVDEITFRAGNGKSLFIKEVLNFLDQFNVISSVESLAGFCSFRFDAFEFGFPETKNIGRNPQEFRDLSYFKIEFIGYGNDPVFHRVPAFVYSGSAALNSITSLSEISL